MMRTMVYRVPFSPSLSVRLLSSSPSSHVVPPIARRVLAYVEVCNPSTSAETFTLTQRMKAIVDDGELLKSQCDHLTELNELLDDDDQEMRKLAEGEMEDVERSIGSLTDRLAELCVPSHSTDSIDAVQIEVEAGVGGQEAMLFAAELVTMYAKYAVHRRWQCDVVAEEPSDIGGYIKCVLRLSGDRVYRAMKFEGGVHRVQRIPKTEKSGRMHTSTASVAVIAEPSDVQINIKSSDIKLTRFRATGAGGMNVDHNDTAVRVLHVKTGVAAESQQFRDYERNVDLVMNKLRTILYNRIVDKQLGEEQRMRKLQVGSRDRSEKIRTYHMPQDRVTDHRIKQSFSQVDAVLAGGEALHQIVLACAKYNLNEELSELLTNNNC